METPWPPCVGTHEEGHVQCDGDLSSTADAERAPCRWRDRCGGFKAHLDSVASTADEYMDGREFGPEESEEFEQQCVRWAREYGVVDGLPRSKRSGRSPFGHRGTCSEAFRRRRQECNAAADHFVGSLMHQFPSRRPSPRSFVRPGQFIVVDRREKSRYLTIYCAGVGVQRVPVAVVYPKARTGGVEIRLPIAAEAWMRRPASGGLIATPIRDGAFTCSLGTLDRAQLGRLARALREMERVGDIRLPETSK